MTRAGRDRSRAGRAPLAAAALFAALLAGGCGPPSQPTDLPPAVVRIDQIVLQAMPTPVNLDDQPGVDGLQARAYLFHEGADQPVPVEGALEFMMFDNVRTRLEIRQIEPLRSWRYAGQTLEARLGKSMFGWGYEVQLPWGLEPPSCARVTLAVRHVPPDGPPTWSQPMTISIGGRPREPVRR